jgi:glutathione S-transferase
MYTLYYSPGSVSMVTHMILEELGVPFETVRLDFSKKEHHEAAFVKINPKRKVPALATDEGVLTESVAILETLLDRHGDGSLLAKPGSLERARTMERIVHLATEIHPLMNRYFHPEDFADDAGEQERLRRKAVGRLVAWFQAEDAGLTAAYWTGRAAPDAADFYFAVIARWGRWFEPKATQMPRIRAFLERMSARPSVQRATAREGNTLFS